MASIKPKCHYCHVTFVLLTIYIVIVTFFLGDYMHKVSQQTKLDWNTEFYLHA